MIAAEGTMLTPSGTLIANLVRRDAVLGIECPFSVVPMLAWVLV